MPKPLSERSQIGCLQDSDLMEAYLLMPADGVLTSFDHAVNEELIRRSAPLYDESVKLSTMRPRLWRDY